MTTIEAIRQEIERRKVQYYEREMKAWDDSGEYGDEDCYFYQGKRKACEGLLSFLDTLSEEPDKSLEEAAGEYEKKHTYQRYDGGGLTPEYDETLAEAFIAGAECQKEQMLKDAVEGEVYKFGEVAYVKERNNAELTKYLSQFNNGDKVRIIIVKEDEK